MPIGVKVTLRGDRAWEFLDRLISLAIPRIRDFRGPVAPVVRRARQLHVRRQRQLIFPEIDYDQIDTTRGIDITIVTTARTDAEGRAFLAALASRSDRRRASIMAKKALIDKQQRTPKFKVRGLHPLPALWPAPGRLPQVRPVPDLPAHDGARRRDPRRDQGELVRGAR